MWISSGGGGMLENKHAIFFTDFFFSGIHELDVVGMNVILFLLVNCNLV